MKITHILTSVSVVALLLSAGAAMAGTFEKTATGVLVKPDSGSVKEIRLEVMSDSIIHVLGVDTPKREQVPSLMTVAKPQTTGFTVSSGDGTVTLTAAKASAKVSLSTGLITFYNAAGEAVLTETSDAITPVTVEGKSFVSVRAQFNPGTTEAFYGLGQHQNAQMNLNGEDVLLSQHNMDVAIPFVVSDKNYGLLWDNDSITRWGDPKPWGDLSRDLKVTSEDGKPGLTARYYVDDKLVLTRIESDIKYQYLKDVKENWPKDKALSKAATAGKTVKVVWDATLTSDAPGVHKLSLYASDYADLSLDGKKALSVWRQGWNAWYHNFEIDFSKGKPVKLHLEWKPSGGMVAIKHNNPLPNADRHSLQFTSDVGTGLNYYFIGADSIDGAIAGYRTLTGQAPLMPKWAYGYWQSRQRYETQDQLLGVLKEYRARQWPIDNMVQDWFYWPEDQWGSHDFDPKRFPDPKGMVDAVHALHGHIMISIWGKFYANTDNYKEFEKKGYMFTQNVKNGTKDWVGPGYLNSHYSPYNQEARDIYYRQLGKLINKGFDAWWMDNTEPDVNSNERPEDFAKLITPTQMGPGALIHNPYALMNTEAMYDGLKRDQPDKRQFILTRSGFAGVQRNAAAVWSGDTASRWNNLYDQISAGVSFSMSGVPNWTHDIGGYAQETRYQGGDPAGFSQENRALGNFVKPEDLKEWRELNLRWFQFGAFSPLFRSHGEVVKREIYEISPEGSDMRDSMVWYDKLRYRLMPYIYATASDTYFNSGTIMRGLVMDFPTDQKVKDIKDEYLFGHALLVAPVAEYGARSRKVYLPAGADWYNFYTGEKLTGGVEALVAAPVTQIPLFVKAGSVLPTGPVTQYVDEKPDAPLTFNVYTGADGAFSLYEDDGVSNDYVKGGYSRIPLSYNDKTGELTIGARTGSYKGMIDKRTFRVRFITPGTSSSAAFDDYTAEVAYTGAAVVVKR